MDDWPRSRNHSLSSDRDQRWCESPRNHQRRDSFFDCHTDRGQHHSDRDDDKRCRNQDDDESRRDNGYYEDRTLEANTIGSTDIMIMSMIGVPLRGFLHPVGVLRTKTSQHPPSSKSHRSLGENRHAQLSGTAQSPVMSLTVIQSFSPGFWRDTKSQAIDASVCKMII